MSSQSLQDWAPYLGGVAVFYTLPLAFSRRARRSASFAAKVLSIMACVAFVTISALFPLGTGLVEPLNAADYLYMITIYVLPAAFVWIVWASFLALRRESNG